ncbi:MAG: hypothetical protein J5490_02640 [Bacteroidales bacterium]|nr:hypothetical protein [Bacteroidales bacterium]
MVSSVDNSYKRGKELLFTINERSTSTYIGREVLPEQLADSFDELTEERLNQMRKSDVAKDYIFCTHCEKKLGEFLESPYHAHILEGRHIPIDVAYYYWISIIWRTAKFDSQSLDMPKALVNSLGKRLTNYIRKKEGGEDLSFLMSKLPFTYKVLYDKDYSKRGSGIIHLEYFLRNKIALFILGDVIFCASFSKHGFSRTSVPYGLDSLFASAPENDGHSEERVMVVSEDDIIDSIKQPFIDIIVKRRLADDKEKIIHIWQSISKKDPRIPKTKYPCDEFIEYVLSELYSEDIKDGNRTTKEHFTNCIVKGLDKIYGMSVESD